MEQLFLAVLNLTVAGSYAILAVLVVRLLLARAPKRWRYLLWTVAAFRLAVPFSFSSPLSLLRFTTVKAVGSRVEYIPADIVYQPRPAVELGAPVLNRVVNGTLPAATPYTSMNPIQLWLFLGENIWLMGAAALLLYSLAALLRLHRRLKSAEHSRENIWYSDVIPGPFVMGWVRPRIYLPAGIEQSAEEMVLAHERYHIRRGDHWVKLAAFCLLVVHWFNPLCWLAFRLMTRDMEMSCDEAVLAERSLSPKAYSCTLLGLAAGKPRTLPSPLHFGESDIKLRIKNILRWKKPGLRLTIAAALVAVVFLAAVAANPPQRVSVRPAPGIYKMETDLFFAPVLTLEDGNRFNYCYSTALSSFPEGACQVKENLLICETEDGRHLLNFQIIDENTLVFVEEGSVFPEPLVKGADAAMEDGARFVRIGEPEGGSEADEKPTAEAQAVEALRGYFSSSPMIEEYEILDARRLTERQWLDLRETMDLRQWEEPPQLIAVRYRFYYVPEIWFLGAPGQDGEGEAYLLLGEDGDLIEISPIEGDGASARPKRTVQKLGLTESQYRLLSHQCMALRLAGVERADSWEGLTQEQLMTYLAIRGDSFYPDDPGWMADNGNTFAERRDTILRVDFSLNGETPERTGPITYGRSQPLQSERGEFSFSENEIVYTCFQGDKVAARYHFTLVEDERDDHLSRTVFLYADQ